MKTGISKEHLGLALLTLFCVTVVKGFYLDWWEEAALLRREVVDLRHAGSDAAGSARQLSLLQTRLQHARLLARKLEERATPIPIEEVPLFLSRQVEAFGLQTQRLTKEPDGEGVWRLTVAGQTESLTAFLFALESADRAPTVLQVAIRAEAPQHMELLVADQP